MPVSERHKGLRGQQEVQRLFQSLGIDLDKLAAQGDRVWYMDNGAAIRLEVKWHERTQLREWIRQSIEETADTMTPAVVWRFGPDHWRIDMDVRDLVGLIGD